MTQIDTVESTEQLQAVHVSVPAGSPESNPAKSGGLTVPVSSADAGSISQGTRARCDGCACD